MAKKDEPTATITTTDGRLMELTGTAAVCVDALAHYARHVNELGLPGEGGGSIEFHVESATKPVQAKVTRSKRFTVAAPIEVPRR